MRNPTVTGTRALSVQQPWAWLIVHGHKDIENRTWWLSHRGRLLIHASQRIDEDGYNAVRRAFPHIVLPTAFDVGGIVGEVRVTDCVRSSASPWFIGPYGFVLDSARPLPFTPMRGRLGLFRVATPTTPGPHTEAQDV